MSLLRAILLWALMLAVPFQGVAAASMSGCAPAPSPVAVAIDAAEAHHAAHARLHGADPHAQVASGHGALEGDAAHDHGTTHDHAAHTCGTCGTCQAVALIGPPMRDAAQPLPPADLGEPARPGATHVSRVLDRPPRA